MTARFYWSHKKLPELSVIPEELRFGTWSVAVRRAHRHWQVWASYILFMGGISFLPRLDVRAGRVLSTVVFAIYLCFGPVVCQMIKIHFARRYIK